jgi:hypothetical protein
MCPVYLYRRPQDVNGVAEEDRCHTRNGSSDNTHDCRGKIHDVTETSRRFERPATLVHGQTMRASKLYFMMINYFLIFLIGARSAPYSLNGEFGASAETKIRSGPYPRGPRNTF